MASLDQFNEKIITGNRKGIEELTKEALSEDLAAEDIIDHALIPAMQEVGRLYEAGEKFIPEMLMSARAMQACMALLEPHIVGDVVKTAGTVVLGTVEGDLHDIGKTLVGVMLEGAGFQVHDLGTDVSPAEFVDSVRDVGPDLVGMSALLTTTMPAMERTIESLEEAGVRGSLVILVGGAPVTAEFAEAIGADGFAEDAVGAVRRAQELVT
jgi:5-methyltetrahydrofolate--homocysteine methyltransferase